MELIRGYLYSISIVVQTIVSLLLTWLGNYSKMKPLKMKCPEWVLIQIYKSVFAELGGEECCLLNTEQITHTHTQKVCQLLLLLGQQNRKVFVNLKNFC